MSINNKAVADRVHAMRRRAHLGLALEQRGIPTQLIDRITAHFGDAETFAGAAASEASLLPTLLRFDVEPSGPLAASLIDAWRACRRGGIEADQAATSRIEAATPGDEPDILCLKPCTSCRCRRCPGRCIWLASHDPLALHACCGHRLPANFNTLTFEERRYCPMANVDEYEDMDNGDGEADVGSQRSPGG
jgi:hypothetical protein